MANENENEKKNVLPKKNVLVMISTHGTWGTTDTEKAKLLKKYYQKACQNVLDTLQAEFTGEESRRLTRFQLNNSFNTNLLPTLKAKINLYLGYDGDGVQGEELVPPTLLLLMLIDKFKSFDPTLIQCQGINLDWGFPQPFTTISDHLNKKKTKEELQEETEENKLKKHEEMFVETLKKEEIQKILEKQENITLAYQQAKEDTESLDAPADKSQTYTLTINAGDGYGGVSFNDTTNSKELVGSTAGWHYFFKNTPEHAPKFDEVYYLPVWGDYFTIEKEKKPENKTDIITHEHRFWDGIPADVTQKDNVEYLKNPITKQIGDACRDGVFKNKDETIKVIETKFVLVEILKTNFEGGGSRSRKRNRRSKRRNLRKKRTFRSKRKSLRRKRHSKRK